MARAHTHSSTKSKYKVVLVDDHPILREGFAQIINQEPDLQVCGQAGTASQALSKIAALKPDLVIVDISLDGTNGIELIKPIKAIHPGLHILSLSVHDETLYAQRALRAGAKGYVMKQASTEEVMVAIRRVVRGEQYLSRRMHERMLDTLSGRSAARIDPSLELPRLSDRQLEIFQLIGEGRGTRQIALQLHLSIKTVETHRAHIKEKLKLRSGLELIRHAVEMAGRFTHSAAEREDLRPAEPAVIL